MTYDNTDTNADGAIDAPVDNESVKTEEELITPADASTQPGSGISQTISQAIRAPDTARAIVLQNQDDTQQNGEGKASIYWYSDSGERLASTVAHPTDNHYSIYTKSDAVGNGDTGLEKRLDIGGGSENVEVNWQNTNVVRTTSDENAAQNELVVDDSGNYDGLYKITDRNGGSFSTVFEARWDRSRDDVRVRDPANVVDFFALDRAAGEVKDLKLETGSTPSDTTTAQDWFVISDSAGNKYRVKAYQ